MTESKIRIYADTNVYGRPFDDLSSLKIALEAEAARILFERVHQNRDLILLGSDILKLEIQKTKDVQKRYWILPLTYLIKEWVKESEKVKKLAQEINLKIKLPPRDSIHLTSAIVGKAHHFISFDKEDFLGRAELIEKEYKIKVMNPIDFIKK